MNKIIILITCIISVYAFYRPPVSSKLLFNAYQIFHRREWYRMFTHGFIHADWLHLIINMFVLFSFGEAVEYKFKELANQDIIRFPQLTFLLFYCGGIIVSSTTTLWKQRDNAMYESVGASGAVSAIVFAGIFFEPLRKIYVYGLIGFPGILIGVLYLIYSYYMSRKGKDNINHDAHFIGAVYGFLFPLLVDHRLLKLFLNQLL